MPNEHNQMTQPTPIDMDLQRSIAGCINHPQKMLDLIPKMRSDMQTITSFSRTVPQHAGMMALQSFHGGAWSKEELGLQKAIEKSREDIDVCQGQARQALSDGRPNGHEGYNSWVRDAAENWHQLLKAWDSYKAKKGKTDMKRMAEVLGQPFTSFF